MKEPCFNIIFEDEKIIIPEIDDYDLLQFSLAFMKIQDRKIKSRKDSDCK